MFQCHCLYILDVYVSLCLHDWRKYQRDRNCLHNRHRRMLHDRFPMSPFYPTGASLPYCPGWLLTVMTSQEERRRGCVKEMGEENQNKWPSTGFDPICGEICVLDSVMFVSEHFIQTGSQTLFLSLCLPPLILIGCHCQVMKGEVNGNRSQPGVMDI